MGEQARILIPIAILVALATIWVRPIDQIAAPAARNGREQGGSGERRDPSGATSAASHGALEPLALHFGLPADQTPAERRRQVAERAEAEGVRIEPLIVLLPDPIETRLDFDFDRELDAVRQALVDAGYTPDRFHLPWQRPLPGAMRWEAGLGDAFGRVLVTGRPDQPARHRTEAGSWLFRRQAGDERSLVLVLLIGESPVVGVRPEALQSALAVAEDVRGFGSGGSWCDGRPIFIVGPRFSGSAASIATIVGPSERFRFRSGTATVRGVRDVLGSPSSRACGDEGGLQACCCQPSRQDPLPVAGWDTACAAGDLRFRSMVPPDDALQEALAQFLKDRTGVGLDDHRVATVFESTTSYGVLEQWWGRRVPYGSYVGSYRSLEHKAGLLESATAALSYSFPRSRPPVSLEGHDRSRDLPAHWSAEIANLTGIGLEAELLDLKRSATRLVLFFGTSSLDQAFLAKLVRRTMPNVQLLFLGGDLLLAHPQFSEELLGGWVVSPFPPSVAASRVIGTEIRPFTSDASTGIHDAVLAALAELGGPKPGAALLERMIGRYDADGYRTWLASIGRGEVWAVDFRPLEAAKLRGFSWFADEVGFGRVPNPSTEPFSVWPIAFAVWMTAVAAFEIWLFVQVVARLSGWRSPRLPFGLDEPLQALLRSSKRTILGQLMPLAFVACLASIAGDGLIVAEWQSDMSTPLLWTAAWWTWWLGWIAAASATALLFCQLAGPAALLADMGALSAAAAGAVLCPSCAGTMASGAFEPLAYERSVALLSGMSPLVPAFLLTATFLTAIATSAYRREHLAAMHDVRFLVENWRPYEALVRKVLVSLGQGPGDAGIVARFWTRAAALGVALLVAVVFLPRTVPSLEGRCFDWALRLAILGTVAIVTEALLRFVDVWWNLRKLLVAVGWSHLVHAFKRLPKDVAEGLDLRLPVLARSGHSLRRSFRQLQALAKEAQRAAGGAPQSWLAAMWGWQGMAERFEEEIARAEAAPFDRTPDCEVAQRQLYAVGGSLLRELRGAWAAWPEEPLANLFKEDGGKEGGDVLRRLASVLRKEDLPIRLAEDFVASAFARFFGDVFSQMKLLTFRAAVGIVLLVVATASYPFQPQRLILDIVLAGVAVLVAVVLAVLVQQDRNEVLAYLRDRSPNKLDLDTSFFSQAFSYAGLPALVGLAALFPGLGAPVARLLGWVGS